MQTIGFIGTGIMGQGMIRNLMKAGYPVQIYNRTRSKAEALEREGAVWKDSAAQCAAGCVFCPGKSCFNQCESALHEKDQDCAHEIPYR